MPNTKEISAHLCRVYMAAVKKSGWHTADEIAKDANVAPRTARWHCSRLVAAGLFDKSKIFPAYMYRLSPPNKKRDVDLWRRIRMAMEALDIK